MDTRQPRRAAHGTTRRAFTLIELLVVIAVIAILAAILFPVFGAVREQARQSNTMSNMHAIYIGARLFYEDEGRFPDVLFPYAETTYTDGNNVQRRRPIVPGDDPTTIVPMDEATGQYKTGVMNGDTPPKMVDGPVNQGFLYREQVKDYVTFLNADNPVKDKRAVTKVYYPVYSPLGAIGTPAKPVLVTWEDKGVAPNGCTLYGDKNIPFDSNGGSNFPPAYVGQPKLFYVMDSMDIGPLCDSLGKQMTDPTTGQPMYELHYSPDWTHLLGLTCDVDTNNNPIVNQLKYRNPPTDRTIITWSTQHVATAGSPSVIILLANGTARKVNYETAYKQLPLGYQP
jgi:prepilin-type N-terminal cleavage/methylation domain-containing protein